MLNTVLILTSPSGHEASGLKWTNIHKFINLYLYIFVCFAVHKNETVRGPKLKKRKNLILK